MTGWQCDLMALAGFLMAVGGLWAIYPPLVLIASGGVLVGLAVLFARRVKRDPR